MRIRVRIVLMRIRNTVFKCGDFLFKVILPLIQIALLGGSKMELEALGHGRREETPEELALLLQLCVPENPNGPIDIVQVYLCHYV